MTDDLVSRLRNAYATPTLCNIAADRIEELEKLVEQARIVFATMRSEMASVCAVMEAFEND